MGISKRNSYGLLRLSLATLALATLASVGAFPEGSSAAAATSRVQTAFGWVEGERTTDGVSVFRGLPYAAPPVGALRWRVPIAPPPWPGVRLATEFSADCLQWPVAVRRNAQGKPRPQDRAADPDDQPPADPSPFVSRGRGESEDCLTLNIWTTAPRSDAHLPVMVWIHGGGYQAGSGAIAEYDGAAFARAGVVLVTLNYRLGALGFLVHPGLTAESAYHSSGNYGLLDQIAALTWIQQNITAFGGNPARVTIFGGSAGSGSCNLLQASPLAKGLFTRVIGESTSQMDSSLGLLGRQSRRQAEEYGQRYAASLGASSVDELRKLPADALKRSDMWFWPLDPDGYMLPEGVFETFQHGHQNDVATLVGYNAAEGVNLRVPWIRPETEEERAAFRHLYGEAENPQVHTDAVAWQMQIWATLQSRGGHQPAYLYQFDQFYPAQNGNRAAPEHASEIIYVFQNFDRVQRAWSAEDRQIGQRISVYWVNFARSGDPNGAGLPHWPEFRAESPQVMQLGPQTRATPAPRQDAYEFIEGYYARRRVSTDERGADYPSLTNIDLSRNDAALAASIPGVAVDPKDPLHVVVVWRTVTVSDEDLAPGPRASQNWVCHLSSSTDGGKSFLDEVLDWSLPDTPLCNAPFAIFGSDGTLYVGATLYSTTGDPPLLGRAMLRRSSDGGHTWSSTVDVIGTDTQERFASNLPVPVKSEFMPYDGARGAVDKQTGRLFLSACYPAPPGSDDHSQCFYSTSADGGRKWGSIYSFGSADWPERWDSEFVVDQGQFALDYIAAAVPGSATCPCLVFATSADDGVTLDRHFVASVRQLDTLVHYPPLAASPQGKGAYSIALVSEDGARIVIRSTRDNGASWGSVIVPEPKGVLKVSRPALTYTPEGALVVMWRGEHADRSYDIYVAAGLDAEHLGAPLRLSQSSSFIPEGLLSNYAVRGDFINTVAADSKVVHAAWTDWRTGSEARVYYGRVPLESLLSSPH